MNRQPSSTDSLAAETHRVTPVMEQFLELKALHPGSLLFYRMGDFYELFFEDAETAARALSITLTKRGKHLGQDIPMSGVPVERAPDYLQRLIAQGHRVAVCEQMEDPAEAKKRGSKSVVKRDVIRLVTPGTLTEDNLLDAGANNFLAAVARAKSSAGADGFALAWIDISTGEFRVTELDRERLAAELARIDPAELIVPEALWQESEMQPLWQSLRAVTPATRDLFDGASAAQRLADYYAVGAIEALGSFSRLELIAAAAAVSYVERTQIGQRPPLHPPSREALDAAMEIDAATRANLELTRTLAGEKRGSLLSVIDRTVTAGGGRLLARRLAAPLTDPALIRRRQQALGCFLDDAGLRHDTRQILRRAPDIARARARLALQRGGPRDLAAMHDGLDAARSLAARLMMTGELPEELTQAVHACAAPDAAVQTELAAALIDEPPLSRRDGGFVQPGYDAALDEARALRDESRRVIAGLERDYAEETGIKSLKIKANNVLGWFIEVSAQHGEKLREAPFNARFFHKQSLAGAMRFTTADLSDLEARIASAGERALRRELEIFDALAAQIAAAGRDIDAAAEALAILDVAAALAELAASEGWVCPRVDDTLAFAIEGGRHPVVEQALKRGGAPFVANGCDLSGDESGAGRIWLVTGPNMGGKSTFLRQNALIAVLAQMGCHVPAHGAHIGIVDRLFSRVGAADDLARGRSTFMVEMVETAAILNQAGPKALVILDEIGRGTATFDGLSIAWAAIEHLHEVNRCRGLFATHYHELTALSARLKRLSNATLRVTEWHGDVVFLHEVIAGTADRSYGIQVAKLAGLPATVIGRAKAVLGELEAADRINPAHRLIDDLPLFAAVRPAASTTLPTDPALTALDDINPDDLTPRDALEALYRLKSIRRKEP